MKENGGGKIVFTASIKWDCLSIASSRSLTSVASSLAARLSPRRIH